MTEGSQVPLNGECSDHLVVTVFGPGKGESIVVTVDDTWIVVDSCIDQGQVRAKQLLDSNESHCTCAILTHPHQDHYRGFLDIVAESETELVGSTYPFVFDPREWTDSPDFNERWVNGELENVTATLQDMWERQVLEHWDIRQGDIREFGNLTITALHPDEQTVENARETPTNNLDLNRLSTPLLLEWGNLRVLLGADLPQAEWDALPLENPPLHQHQFLKFPHHGSHSHGGSLSDVFGGGDDLTRHWVITPYNSSKIPGYNEDEGLDWCLQRVEKVYLTGLPIPANNQAEVPLETTREELVTGEIPVPSTQIGGIDAFIISQEEPQDAIMRCFVSFAFNQKGVLVDDSYGNGSVIVRE